MEEVYAQLNKHQKGDSFWNSCANIFYHQQCINIPTDPDTHQHLILWVSCFFVVFFLLLICCCCCCFLLLLISHEANKGPSSQSYGFSSSHVWMWELNYKESFSSVQSLSCVQLFVTPWITEHQASLSITNSRSLLKLMPIESVMPSSHLILCCPLLLLPAVPPSIRVFSNESALCMR